MFRKPRRIRGRRSLREVHRRPDCRPRRPAPGADDVSVSMPMKLKPFQVPNFALVEMPAGKREEGFNPLPPFPLHELSPETLDALCAEFRAAVFAKAMKKDPKEPR